jgi:propanediol utilization protein
MAVETATINRALVEQIVREAVARRLGASRPKASAGESELVVHASARHMHLCREDLDVLFGPGYELTSAKELYQEGNFAAAETVTLLGPRRRPLANVRVLGPLREASQVELSFTDAIQLGIDAPVRLSGDIDGTPGVIVIGPKGIVDLPRGVIRAAIHVHMNPAEAARYGVKHGDRMKLRVVGPAPVVLEAVQVRVDPASRLNVHMDTDEANACALHLATGFELFK